ncbi:MAG TPA: ABC transporter permease [Dehalococcoidia bacterium]|nr:ABC transporter permease [Dehalococcoidia bacterium]
MAQEISVLDSAPVLAAGAPGRGLLRTLLSFLAEPKAAIATTILAAFIIIALLAPVIAPYGENQQNTHASLVQPSAQHWFGTDRLGRDVFSRVLYGTRVSLRVGFIAVGIAALIGVPLGLVAGFYGGWLDEVIMRVVDAWIAFPQLILLLGVINILGPGTTNVMIAIGLGSFPIYARLIRGQTLSIKQRDFVLSARSLGGTDGTVMFRHILPNTIQPVIVQASLAVGGAVLAEAGLSFLGIGVKPPTATWGVVIQDGFTVIRTNYWISIAPGIAIILFVFAVNLLGDRLRDVLDPRLRGSGVRR